MHKFKPRYNQNVNLTIKSIGFNGEGVGYWHGHTLFVDGALPEEVVRGRIFDCSKKFSRVRPESISNPSVDRVEPPCTYYGSCGGCQLMHMNYQSQLLFKQERVRNAAEKFGGLSMPEVAPCEPSPRPFHYRNKILLPVRGTKNAVRIGLYSRNSHDLVDVAECLVHCPVGEKVFQIVARLVKASDITPYDHATQEGSLRFIMIKTAETTGQVLVTFVAKEPEEEAFNKLAKEIMEALPEVKGVVLNLQPDPGNTALGTVYRTILGVEQIEEVVLGKVFNVSPASFFQVNLDQAQKIYTKAIELAGLTGNEDVLDAYCGVGTLTLCAAPYAKSIIGIECVPEAIEDAKVNAKKNGLSHARFLCGEAEQLVRELGTVDTVFLNPPRKGCEASFLEGLVEKAPATIVYISCDPATLGRDVAILSSHGYKPDVFYPFDMFPQTAHVETIVRMKKNVA